MCGVVGVFGVENAFDALNCMMTALHYRGEQSSGMFLVKDGGEFCGERALGVTTELFRKIDCASLKQTQFMAGVGHLRYGTAGSRDAFKNAQPLYAEMPWGEICLAHNGDMPNFEIHREHLLKKGVVFYTDSDSELLLKYIGFAKGKTSLDAILQGLALYEGTYAAVMLIKDQNGIKLVAARDRAGNRPLALGKLGNGYAVASENQAFEEIGCEFIREVEPGEVLVISKNGLEKHLAGNSNISKPHHCIFENIYFSFPSSKIFDVPVWKFRWILGRKAAEKFGHLVEREDVITYAPNSGKFFGLGFANTLGRPLDEVLIRRHSTELSRSFTQASEPLRHEAIRKKFSIIGELVENKRVWVGEDSIVRGNMSRKLTRLLRNLGAKWVGFLSSAPPIIGPCRKGIDFEENLIAARYMSAGQVDVERVRNEIGADFLEYLTLSDLESVLSELGKKPNDFCFGCFQNKEPIWGVW